MSENLAGGSGAAPVTAPDHRHEPRLRSLLPGKIVLDDKCMMDCMVRNISAGGAKVEVVDAYRLPEQVSLHIPHHKKMHRAALVWRNANSAGFALSDTGEIKRPHPAADRREAARAHQKEMDASQF
jgi:hypothetical protein